MELNKQDIAERFSALSPEKQKEFLAALKKRGLDFSLLPIVPQAAQRRPMLSYAQQRHWFLWQLEPLSTAYHLNGTLRLTGKLDVEAVRSSFDALVVRHESLRTVFRSDAKGMAEQIIGTPHKLDIPLIDLCDLSSSQRNERAHEEIRRINGTPFDLEQGPLLRVALIRMAAEEHLLTVVMHHIVTDDWSNRIIIGEFAAQYRARVQGREPSLPALPIQYADYAAWQRNWLEAGEKERQLAYWRVQLGEDHPVLQLTADHPRPLNANYKAARHEFVLPAPLVAGLQRQAQRQGATLFMALLTGFQALLQCYTGQDDIRVGVPIANRHRIEVENIVGFFVNTQVLRNRIDSRASFKVLLDQAREAALGAQAHQDLPFEQLVEALQPERNLNQNPLFQVMYNHLREDSNESHSLPDLVMENHFFGEKAAQFELTLDTTEHGDGRDGQVSALFSYAAELFEPDTIERLGEHYLHLLGQLAEHPERRLGDIDLLSEREHAQLRSWGINAAHYGDAEPVHRLIERQVKECPEAIALIFGDIELSYGELNRRANRLAQRLMAFGVGPEAKVGIAVERSIEMIVGLLAILKAGGAYVPLDPEYPRERLSYMMEDSGIELLLTQSHIRANIPQPGECKVLELDKADVEDVEGEAAEDPQVRLHGDNLAYVIYTSGSTGKPKGVAVAHGPLSMHVQAIGEVYGMTAEDRELQFASINFDGAHERWLVPLAFGAALMPRDNDIWAVDRTVAEIARHRITIACFTPGYLHQLAELMGSAGRDSPIRSYTVGGEAMTRASFDLVQKVLQPPRIINGYGPTETVVTPLISKAYADTRFESAYMPIGRPVGDRSAYILDPDLNLVPEGVAGELYLGGAGLARGYLNRRGLTAERFIADPFDGKGGRLYRTGDLARWRADGQIEYLGRLDHQVKIRGFRIELGEIEAQLLSQPEVREAVVIAGEGPGGARLVAYVCPHAGMEVDTGMLREALGKALPDYMMPSAIVVLERLPLNPNGKVDRKALPEPEYANIGNYEAPQGEVEQVLAGIWEEVLGLGQVGRGDNFFEVGGDSILSLQIVTRMRRAGWKITPRQLFQRQTVAALAVVAQPAKEAKGAVPKNVEMIHAGMNGAIPLLPIQLEFFQQEIPSRHHWNQAVLLKSSQLLDIPSLAQALNAVTGHHDALCFRYMKQPGGWQQTCSEPLDQLGRKWRDLLWVRDAASTEEFITLCNEIQRSLDLAEGPLLRALIVKMAGGDQRLLLVAHHLVIDGVSWRILLEDLQRAYNGCCAGEPVALPEKTTSYYAWASRLQNYPSEHADELTYWQSLSDTPVSLPQDEPWDNPQVSISAPLASITLRLSQAQTQALLKRAPAAYRTQVNDLLLAALGSALCRWSGHEKILIDLEGHGREDLYPDIDLSCTVGWFTTLYPVVLDPSGDLDQRLKRIKESLRHVPNKGLSYGLFKYHGTPEQRQALACLPKAEAVFNYLGQFDASFDEEALWTLATDPIGDLMDGAARPSHDFSINGHVHEGRLSLDISYSTARYAKATVEAFVNIYEVELEALIAHCTSGVSGATPSDFPLARITQHELDHLSVSMERIEDLYPLSPMQSGMLFHSMYDSNGNLYVNQLRADIEGLEVERFKAAWQVAVHRHDVLRTGFLHQRDIPLQWVAKTAELGWTERDWRNDSQYRSETWEKDLEAPAESEHARGFDLMQPPLMRIALVRITARKYHFIWTIHHMLLDGWSASQLMGEVLQQYAGRKPDSSRGRYREYIGWLQARDNNIAEAHWRHQLRAFQEPTRIARVLPGDTENTGHEEYVAEVDRTATAGLIDFAKRERVTVNTLIQGAWALLLNLQTGQDAMAFGVTIAGRPDDLPGADRLLGLFINTLPVIAKVESGQDVGDWLRELQTQNLGLREHGHTPLYEIQRWGGQSGQGLFDSILVFENYPMDEALKEFSSSELVFSAVRSHEVTNYAMTVSVTQTDKLCLHYGYADRDFSAAQVRCIADRVSSLLKKIAQGSALRLGDIDLLSEREHAQLRSWGINAAHYGDAEPVHRLIERQVKECPEAIALIFGDIELSYGELNRRANRLAQRLMAFGVGPEAKVGIAVERSIEMIIGLLAILKAGGAYVPLDPEYPRERLSYMMEDSGIELLLTQSHIRANIPQPGECKVLELDKADVEDVEGEAAEDPQVRLHGDNLAYVIYTSGSTGKPKGVGLPHHALAEHAQVATGFFGLSAADRMLLFSTINFDGFIEQLFAPLCVGAAIVLRGPALWDSETFYRELLDKRITVADLTTAYWFLLVQDFARHGSRDYGLLRQVHAGGEAMPPEGIKAWRDAGLGNITLLNTYGPTEATVTATALDCRHLEDDAAPVSIGKPLAGRHIHLLDGNLAPVAPGVAGELCIGGELLARGYLNRGGLTAERFIADPFDGKGGRLYRTGDLARWRADGQIEYLGRLDHQVKIRGFRIELGEIEAQLLSQPEVREAVVIAGEGSSGARLVAYVCPHAGMEVDTGMLREALGKALPDYMIPSAIVVLERLPLNPNGKVDRKALPEPEYGDAGNYEAPQGEVEQVLAGIWEEVLGIGQVGRNDNFFEVGGDSILSLQIVTRMRRAGWKITPRQVFEHQNVAALAVLTERVETVAVQDFAAVAAESGRGYLCDYLNAEAIAALPFREDEIEDIYPLAPIQEGMLFHTLEAPGNGLYVTQLNVSVEGLDPERLAQAWRTMIVRHQVLRTGFLWQAGLARPLQAVFKQVDAAIIQIDWRGLDNLESRIAAYADEDLKREFDFLTPPVARLSLIRTNEDCYQLVWTKHHILLDGWGDSLLISDWLRCYAGEMLEASGPGYGRYVRWLGQQDVEATRAFWKTELQRVEDATLLAGALRTPSIKDKADKEGRRTGYAQIYTHLSVDETRDLQAFVQRERLTLNTFVQAAWGLLLQRYTGKDTVVFGVTVAGRSPNLPKSDEILGLFINTIPVPVERRSNLTVSEYLGVLQGTNARLREHEHTSLADIQRWVGSPGQPLFDSIVVYENFPIAETLRSNELYGLRFGDIEGKGLTGYAMDLQVVVGDRLEIEYSYGCRDFTDDFVLELRSHMEFLMREMMAHPRRRMGELAWMGSSELNQMMSLGRNSEGSSILAPTNLLMDARQPVHRLIEHHATAQPLAIALLMGEQELSYAELNTRANRLAHHLIDVGIHPEMRVGVAMERSLEVIVALLAILKAGGAYVPLDIEYPVDRLSFMMEDSSLSLLITQNKVLAKLKIATGMRTLALDSIDLITGRDANPDVRLDGNNLAYVIYTSGSTGIPKGVAVTHGPLAMHCQATAEIYGMNAHSCELLFMSFSFDGAHERWLTALTVGAGLAVRDQELWTAEQTYDALRHYGITNAAFPPAYLGQVAEWAAPRNDPPPVELYVFGGEAMPKASYDLIRQTLRPRILINGYGPTETVVTPLIWKTEAKNSFECMYAPIGRPVGERTAYILDRDMQPVPVGAAGELYIGGYGLARGYLERPGLTAERFIADPFGSSGGRLYRTGDLARWLDDGNIEYLGRVDHQVKIRGFRIELGEIEACLREATGIADVAVVVHESKAGPQLVAYVVPVDEAPANELIRRLKQELGNRLPDYMMASYIMPLAVLPRLPSGKLDRGALPQPGAAAGSAYKAPSTEEARMLAKIWKEVLGVEQVGETDNFFALGGDSLSSLKVMARMRNLPDGKFNFKLRDLMQRPTIAGLLGLETQAPPGVQQHLLALNQPCEAAAPLFCLHAGLGTVFDYRPLALSLQGKRTVYGVPCRMLADSAHRDVSLEQMAADYCRMVRIIQPKGPYYLLGWSLGGALAAMVAAFLEADAQDIAFLGLIDPYIPGVEMPEPDDWRRDFSDFISVVIPSANPDVIAGDSSVQAASEESGPAIVSLLKRLLQSETMRQYEKGEQQTEGYAGMRIDELAHTFTVARRLKALALQSPALNALQGKATCWWAARRPVSELHVLAAQIEQQTMGYIEVEADHFSIVRNELLLQGIKAALEAIPTSPSEIRIIE